MTPLTTALNAAYHARVRRQGRYPDALDAVRVARATPEGEAEAQEHLKRLSALESQMKRAGVTLQQRDHIGHHMLQALRDAAPP